MVLLNPHRLAFTLRRYRYRIAQTVREGWYRWVRAPAGGAAWFLWNHLDRLGDGLISRRNGISRFPQLTALEIDPASIHRFVPDEAVDRRHFIWPEDWDLRALPLAVIKTGTLVDGPGPLLAYLQSQLALFESLATRGFRPGLAPDQLNVAVGRSGELIKANAGCKRFFAAHILGLETIPVRVAYVHSEWIHRHRRPGESRLLGLQRALRALQPAVVAVTAIDPGEGQP